ncbi:MAG: hypothetical protein WCA00_11855 [Candidatus Acidiferrales bacterium]
MPRRKKGARQRANMDWAGRAVDGRKTILPLSHKAGFREVHDYSPELAERVAVSTDKGLHYAVERILEAAK